MAKFFGKGITRILFELRDEAVCPPGNLKQTLHLPDTALLRKADSECVTQRHQQDIKEFFGLWGKNTPNGVGYEKERRKEWHRG